MEKKYKNGLVLGKMYPVTTGHKYLIDTAIENCENVHVIISHNSQQNIPGEVRYQGLKKTYQNNPNVTVYQFDDTGLHGELSKFKGFILYFYIYNIIIFIDLS